MSNETIEWVEDYCNRFDQISADFFNRIINEIVRREIE